MKTILIIIGIAAGGWFLLMIGFKFMAAALRKSAARAALSALHGEEIMKMTDNASFLGADFPGPNLPRRTSGVLAVTRTRIFFLPWFPRRPITLPRETVARVNLQDYFGETAYNIPALVFEIKGVKKPHGAMGWLVHEGEDWRDIIKSIL